MAGPFPQQPSLFGSTPPQFSVLGGQGGQSSGTSALLSLLLPLLQQQMGARDLVPAQFLPAQNPYDQLLGRRFQEGQQLAAKLGAERDARTYKEFFTGAYNLVGSDPSTPRAQAHIQTMASDVAGLAPFLAAFAPESFDAMHGRRGSALVMSQAVHRAGQHALDPTTGRMGMRGDSAGRLSQELFDSLYGPGASMEDVRGMSAGNTGMLYEELSRRGMLDPSIGTMSRGRQASEIRGMQLSDTDYQRIADRTNSSVEAVKQAHQQPFQGNTELSDEMLTMFDAGKVKNRVKNMSAAVSAMRDIFGDAGNPNAPMSELMQALDQLTQGSLATQSPVQIEKTVRSIHHLAKTAGVDMQGVLGLSGHGAAMADRFGLDRSFVPQLLQSTLSFGAAAGASGMFNTPAWGASNKDKLTLMQQQLSLSAAASPNVNRINTLLRMQEQGLIDESTPEGKQLADLAAAAKKGDAAAMDHPAIRDDVQFAKLARGAGVNTYMTQTMLGATAANQEYGNRHNTGRLGYEMQYATDITPTIAVAFGSQMTAGLQKLGVTDPQGMGEAVGRRVANDMRNSETLNNAVMSDSGKRKDALAASMRKALEAEMVKAGRPPSDAARISDRELRGMAEAGWGSFDQQRRRHGSTAIDTTRLYRPEVLSQMQRVEQDAALEGQLSSALSSGGSAGPLRNFFDAVREAGPDTDAVDMLYKTLGGTKARYTDSKGAPLTSIAAAHIMATNMRDGAEVDKDKKLTTKGVAQSQRAIDIQRVLSSGLATPEEIDALAAGDTKIRDGLIMAVKVGGTAGAMREVGIDPDAAPAPYIDGAELRQQLPAEVVTDRMTDMFGLPATKVGAIKDELQRIFSDSGRHTVGAKAVRSRAVLLQLARDKGYITGTGAEAERAGIDKLLADKELAPAERDKVNQNREDYGIIQDIGTERMDSASEVRDQLGKRVADRATGPTRITGTLQLLGDGRAQINASADDAAFPAPTAGGP